MKTSAIGVFDSGIGGLSVVKEIKRLLPKESIIYLADKANFPYGGKTAKQIRNLSVKNVKCLLSQKVKLVVVGCNTATINAISFLREKFPLIPFVGMEPAVKPAAKLAKKAIIILSSPKATSSIQTSLLIKKFAENIKVYNIGSLKLVKAVEKQLTDEKVKQILKKAMPQKILNKADVLVLGCTHFPLIKDQIQRFAGKKIKVIDSGEAVAKRVAAILKQRNLLNKKPKPYFKFFTTS